MNLPLPAEDEGKKMNGKQRFRPVPGREVRVAISGRSGCGNTTVSRLLAETLGVTLINYTFRNIAAETGVSLADILEKAKTDFSYDKTVDTRQVELARQGSCVLGSRLAIWMLPEADLKVFLSASPRVRAERILRREGGTLEEILRFTEMRDQADSARYQELYRINNQDISAADLVVDTEQELPEAIVGRITEVLLERGLIAPV